MMINKLPWLFYEADKGTGDGTGDATGDKGGSEKPTPTFTQADVDRIVKERLERESAKVEKAAQKAREEAETKALADQQKFQELAEKRAKALTDLEATAADLTGKVESATQRAERYEKALTAMLTEQRKRVPDHLHSLLDKLPVDEQLAWIASNGDKLTGATGVPATPKPAGLTDVDKERAQATTAQFYRSKF